MNDGTLALLWQSGRSILGLRREDVWLASFPRAGSTWVRLLLCNLLSQLEMAGREVDYHVLGTTMPSFGRNDLLEPWKFKSLPRFIKTHHPYRPLLFARPARAVYVLRDPRDAMVSFYHFRQKRAVRPFHGRFGDFIRHPAWGLEAYLRHHRSWQPHITHTLRYESLLGDTAGELRRALGALDITVPDSALLTAVERSSFKQMALIQDRSGVPHPERVQDPQFRLARRGVSKQWLDYFDDEDRALYARLCRQYRFEPYNSDGRPA